MAPSARSGPWGREEGMEPATLRSRGEGFKRARRDAAVAPSGSARNPARAASRDPISASSIRPAPAADPGTAAAIVNGYMQNLLMLPLWLALASTGPQGSPATLPPEALHPGDHAVVRTV